MNNQHGAAREPEASVVACESETTLLAEYSSIRQEIQHKVTLQNNLHLFTVTTSIAILAMSLQYGSSVTLLLPLCILLPTSLRILQYKQAMMKLGTYLEVCVEPKLPNLNWETRNAHLVRETLEKSRRSHCFGQGLQSLDILLLGLVSLVLFIMRTCCWGWLEFVLLGFAILLLVLTGYQVWKLAHNDEQRVIWKSKWEEVMGGVARSRHEASATAPGFPQGPFFVFGSSGFNTSGTKNRSAGPELGLSSSGFIFAISN